MNLDFFFFFTVLDAAQGHNNNKKKLTRCSYKDREEWSLSLRKDVWSKAMDLFWHLAVSPKVEFKIKGNVFIIGFVFVDVSSCRDEFVSVNFFVCM